MCKLDLVGCEGASVPVQLEVTGDGVRVGASVPLSVMVDRMKALIASEPPSRTSTLRAVVEQLRWFAGVQVPPCRHLNCPP